MRTPLVFLAFACPLVINCAARPPTVPEPRCAEPAPLQGTFDARVPDYLVALRDGVDTQSEVARLAQHYGFSPTLVFQTIPGFAAAFDDDVREMLRCEPSVAYIEYDSVIVGD